jgi:hypothetical protein
MPNWWIVLFKTYTVVVVVVAAEVSSFLFLLSMSC